MKFQEWFPFYLQITDSLGINRRDDYISSLALLKIMGAGADIESSLQVDLYKNPVIYRDGVIMPLIKK